MESTIFKDSNFRSRNTSLTAGNYPGLAGLNDAFRCIASQAKDCCIFPSIQLFTQAKFKGIEQTITGSAQVTDYGSPFVEQEQISSAKVPEGTKLILFEDSESGANWLELGPGDHPNLEVFGFTGKISSLQIIQNELELINIEYTSLATAEGEPRLVTAHTENHSDRTQESTLRLETEYHETFTRSFSKSMHFGTEITKNANLEVERGPLSANLEQAITKRFEDRFIVGTVDSKTRVLSAAKELQVTVPPRSLVEATMTITPVRATIDAIYTFRLIGTDIKVKQNVIFEIVDAAVGAAEIKPFRPISS